ncbi:MULTISPECIES: SRPBCC domain-containing protein [unclassified Rhizobium]|uniref:SRPBCC family protein n=1 Tax=unclassified Rhizobium TaxID=2613769 RepID=UPI000EAA2DCA|nr:MULTISPECIES: SRPBCC domain-containing protein [unclassified Rhizobium]AYG64998.1 SRPBCC domain-containing protein [Rhizobium sp. CCGE531]AYG71483.1 SRPBCC domain-containing protein [Rhizobium sp. CCGE532]
MIPATEGGSMRPTREIVLTRDIAAPRVLLFRLWTEPEHLMRWWGPQTTTASSVSIDLREGGAWRHCILTTEGREYWSHGRYLEIVPPQRLVFTFAWENQDGKPGHPMQVTVEFHELGEKTRLVFRKAELPDDTELRLQTGGWEQALDKYVAYAEATSREG